MPSTFTLRMHRWQALTADERAALIARPAADAFAPAAAVAEILRHVRQDGDRALRELSRRYDGVDPGRLRVSEEEFAAADERLPARARRAIQTAIDNVRRFHEAQKPSACAVETVPGVNCERLPRPIDCVGLYVPAGTAPLPSAAVMLAVPAAIAGCRRRLLCTPPTAEGGADAAVLVAARLAGVTDIYKIGGAQAIAAMAYGTESVPKADKIFGPGNAWVTAAKTAVAAEAGGPAIDLPAGPSEVMVIADANADGRFVAADLLSQAEHGPDSQVLLLTTSTELAQQVATEVDRQLEGLSRRDIAVAAMEHSRLILVDDLEQAVEICNLYAPEHLILQTARPRDLLPAITSAGSVFLGPWSPESAGDYCSGTNHVLPTAGSARAFSGLSVEQFMRQMTVQELSENGLRGLADTIVELAHLEGLDAHARAVTMRLRGDEESSKP